MSAEPLPEELENAETPWRRFRRWCAQYDAKNLTLMQKIVGVLSLVALIHFGVGCGLWGFMISIEVRSLIRNSMPRGRFWWDLWTWLPFFSRSWKSLLPFELALLAIYQLPHRSKFAAGLVAVIYVSSTAVAWYDISHQHWDIATFGGEAGGHMQYYFTWWWCQQRPW